MDRIRLREKVIELRRKGRTYLEIQKSLRTSIPKSTLSYWCRDVKLPKEYQERINKIISNKAQKGRAIALIVNKVKRERYLKSLFDRNKYLDKFLTNQDIAKIALAMLYLGEGAKWRSHRGLQLGSSDPEIIKIYVRLLERCYDIKKEKLRARISYRADQNIEELTNFWSGIIGISKNHFYKTKPDPRTKGRKTKKENYKGVCVINYAGTEIQLELDIIARKFLKA